MQRILEEWMPASSIVLFGLLFLFEYHFGWAVSRTWPLVVVLWGGFRAAAALSEPSTTAVGPPSFRPSVFGPVLWILAGCLLLANNYFEAVSVMAVAAEGWPWLLVAWGGSWMIEDALARASYGRRPRPMGAGSVVLALLTCLIGVGVHGVLSRHGLFAALAEDVY